MVPVLDAREPVQRIAFFKLSPTSDAKGFLGAILVTDEIGRPLEFRVTYPVKPTAVQRTLYGVSLIPHIGVELCGKPLYNLLQERPALLLVEDDRFLPLSTAIATPVARVRPVDGLSEYIEEDTKEVLLNSPDKRFTSVAVAFPGHYEVHQRESIIRQLQDFLSRMDLIEPFQRIERALEVLADEDERFR